MEKKREFAIANKTNSSVVKLKKQIRKQVLERRNYLDEAARQEFSKRIVKNLTFSVLFEQASILHIYLSFGSEVETSELIKAAFAAGKRVVTSVIMCDSNELAHTFILPETQFESGEYGVPTPKSMDILSFDEVGLTNSDIIIVPLAAFDNKCHRLGYGKGYYDRFLARSSARRAGIAFACQEIDAVPTEPHDVPLDYIFTEIEAYTRKP